MHGPRTSLVLRLPHGLASGIERQDIALIGANGDERRIRTDARRKLAPGFNPPCDGAARGIDANDGAATVRRVDCIRRDDRCEARCRLANIDLPYDLRGRRDREIGQRAIFFLRRTSTPASRMTAVESKGSTIAMTRSRRMRRLRSPPRRERRLAGSISARRRAVVPGAPRSFRGRARAGVSRRSGRRHRTCPRRVHPRRVGR